MRDFGAHLLEEGFSFVPCSRAPTYYVNAQGISTLDYLFFNPSIQVGRVETRLFPRISHAAVSTSIRIPFPPKGTLPFSLLLYILLILIEMAHGVSLFLYSVRYYIVCSF